MKRTRTIVAVAIAVAALLTTAVLLPPRSARPVTATRLAISTHPATTRIATTQPPPPLAYLDLVRADNPLIAATQPLELPVDLPDAAHVVLHEPVDLDPAGHLWITAPPGRSAEQVLASPLDPPQHVLRDRVLFAHWNADDNGVWAVSLVVAGPSSPQLVHGAGRQPLPPHPYHWDRAVSWQNRIVVPTDRGVAVIDPQPRPPVVLYHDLPATPLLVPDVRGLLAWVAPTPPTHPTLLPPSPASPTTPGPISAPPVGSPGRCN